MESRTVPFDTGEGGIVCRIRVPDTEIDFTGRLRLTGTFSVQMEAHETAAESAVRDLCATLAVILAPGDFGLPEEIPARGAEISAAVGERVGQRWQAQGLLFQGLTIASCALDPNDQAALDRFRAVKQREAALHSVLHLADPTWQDAERIAEELNAALKRPESSEGQGNPPARVSWACSCGGKSTGNFCPMCGAWRCRCGEINRGNFCGNCGAGRP